MSNYYVYAHYCEFCTTFVYIGFTDRFVKMYQSKINTNNFKIYVIEQGLTREKSVKMVKKLRKDYRI